MNVAAALPLMVRQLPPELRTAIALVAEIGADSQELGPPAIPGHVRRGLDAVGEAAGVPPLLLAALAAHTGGLGSDYWRANLSGVARVLGEHVQSSGVAAGVRGYLLAAGYERAAARELAGRVMGSLLILSARDMEPEGFRTFAEVLRG